MRQILRGNIEEFISLIRSRPALYNFTLEEFNDKRLNAKLWKEIAHKFNTNVDYCKTKWGVLRVSFARQMRNEKTNANRTNETQINDWYLKDNMSFMRNYMRRRKKPKTSENDNNESLSKSTFQVKTEANNLSCASVEIKNEPVHGDDDESIDCMEIFVEDDISELRPDFISIASSSPSSNSETFKTENEVNDTFGTSNAALNSASSKVKRKSFEQKDQTLSFSNSIPTDREYEQPFKRKKDIQSEDALLFSSRRNIKEQEDLSISSLTSFSESLKDDPTMTFFMSILPDFNKLTGRRQRLLKQKVMGELHILLDEQENES